MRKRVLVGTVLYGHCGGYFGHSYGEKKRLEAIGPDWVVAREDDGYPAFARVDPDKLEEFTEPEEEQDRRRTESVQDKLIAACREARPHVPLRVMALIDEVLHLAGSKP